MASCAVATDSPPSYHEAMTTVRDVGKSSCFVTGWPCAPSAAVVTSNPFVNMLDAGRPHASGKSVTTNRGPFGRTGRRRAVRPVQPDLNHGLDPTKIRQRIVCKQGCGCFDLLLSLFGP
ncbi:hypothetical protein OUZ56_019756 [Daphnia magna]|uniref:Uncharacterized protein n=1 Tax=Daphnia magna TaxID=35525 RepID=A0ABQ9ZD25_9CRUS|nr:hypothetical protein OUZ56_019756 [Daphnia magna]